MNRDTFPYYGPFNELTSQKLDAIDQAHHEFQLNVIKLELAKFALTHPGYSYDQEALNNAVNRRVIPTLHRAS
jgi:hypothetical protein